MEQRGFTLVEIVVSVGIIAVMLLLFYAMYSNVLLVQDLKKKDIALKIASDQIELLRAQGYDALPASGSFSNSQLSLLSSGTGEVTVSDYNSQIKQVDVVVSWNQPSGSQSVSLTTLMVNFGGLK